MNRSLAIVSVLALFSFAAGCASPDATEEDVAATGEARGDALESMIDEPAEVPADGAKPKVEAVDVSKIHFDLEQFKDVHGRLDLSRLNIDVLDTGTKDHDYYGPRQSDADLKWVQSDKHQLPAFVDTIAHGVDVGGGGKCRISSISLKKIVVGCKWTF